MKSLKISINKESDPRAYRGLTCIMTYLHVVVLSFYRTISISMDHDFEHNLGKVSLCRVVLIFLAKIINKFTLFKMY